MAAIKKAKKNISSNENVYIKKPLLTRMGNDIKRNHWFYIMIAPTLLYFAIFKYWPMYGVQLAFKEYYVKKGITGSPWVGFEHFERFFSSHNFMDLLANSLIISLATIAITFPLTIVFAFGLNYLVGIKFKKTVQMVSYAPHFISTVIICGMISIFLSTETGVVNKMVSLFGMEQVSFMSKPEYFLPIYIISELWQTIGWGSIIYISALAGVDPALHESAIMDGATKVQRMWSIDLPCIKPTVVVLLILKLGSVMNLGFEKIFLLQNDLNRSASDVISTYIYRMGIQGGDYEYTTAIGLFNSAINIILLLTVNYISEKLTEESLF